MFNAMVRAEIWLQENLDKPLGIEALAEHLGYSPSQVRRQFRQCFHTSPNAYREKRRLERATVLLAFTLKNIAQIAHYCGYSNHSSFSRAFQRQHGVSPRNFRHALRRNLSQELYAPATSIGYTPPVDCITSIEKSAARQTVMMRLYQPLEQIEGLGNSARHADNLESLTSRLASATPIVALPDALAAKVGELEGLMGNAYPTPAARTDVGLYLNSDQTASDMALPIPYRRLDLGSHYYAKTVYQKTEHFHHVLNQVLYQLVLGKVTPLQISGEPPQILWYPDHLELRIPLVEEHKLEGID
ncbi:helix-turn-helix domain-containing protein [Halomonas sp. ZH2S]|uniref:Helix-turn-helix domain-containing protein n=1 Tax=Vreelandella zhuhanensis TaxID=2684210 RepID=A0A7X3GXF3_9GAMM|nr:AraC family transcriptional regulator [Halomonas zhuhanensis]MWJ26675.1 helix-turn-helix domain-containing protein [Halomonas zhuhanensis]